MTSISVIVVDDEPIARRALRRGLDRQSDMQLVAECPNGLAALEAIVRYRPDLVLLDIQMPGMNGFEVIEHLPLDALPIVIFVTAHDEHAIRAFEVNALDYLLKPFDEDRLNEALKRARSTLGRASQRELAERLHKLLDHVGGDTGSDGRREGQTRRLLIRDRGRIFFLDTTEIDYVESVGNYVRLHHEGTAHLMRSSLTELERLLDASQFARIHRSYIVNLARVAEIEPFGGSDYRVVLKDGRRLNVGRGYRDRLLRHR